MENDLTVRKARGNLGQADLTDWVGVPRQTINAIEDGRYDPSLELTFRLAAHFDWSVGDIFDPQNDGE